MTSQATRNKPPFSPDTIIAEAIDYGADVASVFVKYRMYCIGCTFARFEDLRAAAANHRVDVQEFVESLNKAAREAAESKEGSQSGDPDLMSTE